jgi:hypothetical protein
MNRNFLFDGVEIRQSLRVHRWEEVERELERLKQRLTKPKQPSDGPTTLAYAWDEFERDAKSRQLREPTLNKYRYLRNDKERFAAQQGLRFIAEFSLDASKVACFLAHSKPQCAQESRTGSLFPSFCA